MTGSAKIQQLDVYDLRPVAACNGPCVTMLIPIETHLPAQNRNENRVTKAIRTARDCLTAHGLNQAAIDSLFGELTPRLVDNLTLQPGPQTLVILRSPDIAINSLLAGEWEEGVWVSEHFFIKPLLQLRDERRNFCILALSQKSIKLFRCTVLEWTPIDLRGIIPESLEQAMLTKPPDHRIDRSTSGPSGSMTFGTGADEDAKNEYLAHFFKMVDRGVHEILRSQPMPLVLAGVHYEVCLYRKVSTYPNLVEETLSGALGNSPGELHKRALELVEKTWEQPLDSALAEFENLAGRGRALTGLKKVVRNSREGRVSRLLVAREGEPQSPNEENLVNAAVIHALLSSSEIFLLPRKKMPHGAQLAALLRF